MPLSLLVVGSPSTQVLAPPRRLQFEVTVDSTGSNTTARLRGSACYSTVYLVDQLLSIQDLGPGPPPPGDAEEKLHNLSLAVPHTALFGVQPACSNGPVLKQVRARAILSLQCGKA